MNYLRDLLDEVQKAVNDLNSQYEVYTSLTLNNDDGYYKIEMYKQKLYILNIVLQLKLQCAITMSKEVQKTLKK